MPFPFEPNYEYCMRTLGRNIDKPNLGLPDQKPFP